MRDEQAARTREAVLAAAADEFSRNGYQSTTMAAIARAAGVSAETVKAQGSKGELLLAAFEVRFSGSEGARSLADSAVGSAMGEAPDEVLVDVAVQAVATANSRGYALWTILLGAALSDPAVAAQLDAILARRAADLRTMVDELVRRGLADPAVDRDGLAAQLSFVLSPEGFQQLVVQSGWSHERYTSWLRSQVGQLAASVDHD